MASLKGLAYYALQNQLMGRALIVSVGGHDRCMVAEMAPNKLASMAGEGNVPQIRFICDGYCGIKADRPSKQCRTIDRTYVANTPVTRPPGLVGVANAQLTTPYRPGEAASNVGTTTVAPPAGYLGLGGAGPGTVLH